jgi:hypothetical protein
VTSAVVYLRGVDPRRSRPWDLPEARVELRDHRYHVLQGGTASTVGFVRTGEMVQIVSQQPVLHLVQGRGTAFFSLPLNDQGDERSRRLDTPGVVELSSGCGYFWARAWLHVVNHPYITRVDARDGFQIERIPAGEYDIVVWHPDWRVAREERNTDNFRVQQVRFRPALEQGQRVRIEPGRTVQVDLELGLR